MVRSLAAALLLGACGAAHAASVTLAALAGEDESLSYGVDARFSPTESWFIGAGVGKSSADVSGADFSGTQLNLATGLQSGGFSAGASLRRWKDSNQLESVAVQADLGWTADNGLAVTALVDSRDLNLRYTRTVLGATREARIDFKGTGFGADVSWFGEQWNMGARYIDYSYGRSVARVRAALEDANTVRFPRLGSLLDSVVTRAAGAPDRQFVATVGKDFAGSSLQAEWSLQRDALTREKVRGFSAIYGIELGRRFLLDTTVGVSDSGAEGSALFGGLALTLQTATRD